MIFTLLLFILTGFSLVLQDFIPAIEMAWDARILLVPVVFFACGISVPYPVMLLLAFVTGFVWDALNHTAATFPDIVAAAPQVGAVARESGSVFGFSIILFAVLGSFMHGIRDHFRRGRWELPVLLSGVGVFLMLLLEYFFLNIRRGGFVFTEEIWRYIGACALLSMMVSPFVFLLIRGLAMVSGYRIMDTNLKRRRRIRS